MYGPPSRDNLFRRIEESVAPAREPAIVTGVGTTSFSCIVGGVGGRAAIIDHMGPDQLRINDLIWVRRLSNDPWGSYEYLGRRVSGGSVQATNDLDTGDPIPPVGTTPVTPGSTAQDVLDRLDALEAEPNGHIIVGPGGTIYPMRAKLKFEGDVEVIDDAGADTTIVRFTGTAAGLNYNVAFNYNEPIYYDG